jgi:hypothetical protein
MCEQLHRALDVGEEDGDVLALALQGGPGGPDLLGEVPQDSGELNFACAVSVGRSDAPQPPQNSSPGSFEKPHEAQVGARVAPHFGQKRRPSRFSAWQRGQVMALAKSAKRRATPGSMGISSRGASQTKSTSTPYAVRQKLTRWGRPA